jgi:hypothetical protein
MRSDNVKIFSVGFGPATQIDQCKCARKGPLLSFNSIAATRLNHLVNICVTFLMCFNVTKFRYNEYNFVTHMILLY